MNVKLKAVVKAMIWISEISITAALWYFEGWKIALAVHSLIALSHLTKTINQTK